MSINTRRHQLKSTSEYVLLQTMRKLETIGFYIQAKKPKTTKAI